MIDVSSLTADKILNEDTFLELFEIVDRIDRLKLKHELEAKAKQLKVKAAFSEMYRAFEAEEKKIKTESVSLKTFNQDQDIIYDDIPLKKTDKGGNALSIENFSIILQCDPSIKGMLKLNEMGEIPEKHTSDGKVQTWSNVDDAVMAKYIEKEYNLYSPEKLNSAMLIEFKRNTYNPIKKIIESTEWDGKKRIDTLLQKWLKVEDTAYTSEVCRLLFAGGINRLYEPGCKFDDMIMLLGNQGTGKTTFVQWLAIKDEFFREITTIEGKEGMELLRGAWICEIGELLALKRTKDVEAVKSFTSRQVDYYREAYGRRVEGRPRQCLLMGTSNHKEVISDKTGGRRFFPVWCNADGYELFNNEKEVRADILQCWAEAFNLYKQNKLPPVASKHLLTVIRKKQNSASEDDYRIGLIEKYLENTTKVCGLEIWEKALKNDQKMRQGEAAQISVLMQSFTEWERSEDRCYFDGYGRQRYWVKRQNQSSLDEDLPF